MKNKKITFLINSLTSGGAERVLSIILNELDKQGYNVELISLEKNNFYEINKNIKVTYLSNSNGKSNPLLKLINIPILAYKLKKYIIQNNITNIQSHIYRANFVNILSKVLGSKHTVQIVNAGQVSMYKTKGLIGKVNLYLIHKLYPKANIIICKSKGMEIDLQTHFDKKLNTIVINNPYDIEKINKLSKEDISEIEFKDNNKYLLYVGRFASFKKPEYVINALKSLDDNIHLILLGDGPRKDELKNLINSLGLEKRVHLMGNVKNPYKYMQKSDVFILSSDDGEGFPNVLAEAMLSKSAVISTDCKSGPREILSPTSDVSFQLTNSLEIANNGILVPTSNISIMAEAIDKILKDDTLKNKLEKSAYKRGQDFSLESIIKEYKKVLEIE